MDRFISAGLGLDDEAVRLVEAQPDWIAVAAVVCDELAVALAGCAAGIEHIGSTAVPGLFAKPILDFAIGIRDDVEPESVRPILEGMGWQFTGDAGDEGGLVFVLDAHPLYRVAHAHVVRYDGVQWRDYVQLRDRLRVDARARTEYGKAKLALHARFPKDRSSYTSGKTAVIRDLLSGNHPPHPSASS